MTYLVTGAAGFIGYHVARRLLERGDRVIGVDNLSPYYDIRLKRDRLRQLEGLSGFEFHMLDLAEYEVLSAALAKERIRHVIHLAAQAGVRHSINNPHLYVRSNVTGHLNVLEFCRRREDLVQLVYASSSSVYGGNRELPFSEKDAVDTPHSLYAATKRADELMSYAYAHLYRIPQTGLRFFTVYGPWGRPDMSYWLFTEAILRGEPITVFNNGEMERDFTYVDDIVTGVVAASDRLPNGIAGSPQHRIYNIGNNRPEPLLKLIKLLEDATEKKAIVKFAPMQPGDVKATYANIDAIRTDLQFEPTTSLQEGIPKFVSWYRSYVQHG